MCPSASELIEYFFTQHPGKRRAALQVAGVFAIVAREGQQLREALARRLRPLDQLPPLEQGPDVAKPVHRDPALDVRQRDRQQLRLPLDLVRQKQIALEDQRIEKDGVLGDHEGSLPAPRPARKPHGGNWSGALDAS